MKLQRKQNRPRNCTEYKQAAQCHPVRRLRSAFEVCNEFALARCALRLRMIVKAPGFAGIAILTLALGIGREHDDFQLDTFDVVKSRPGPGKSERNGGTVPG